MEEYDPVEERDRTADEELRLAHLAYEENHRVAVYTPENKEIA